MLDRFFGPSRVQHTLDAVQGIDGFAEPFHRFLAGDGLNPAHTRGDGSLVDDLADTDIAGAVHVRAAAKLLAEARAPRPRGPFAVLLAEERHSACRKRLVEVHDVRFTSTFSRISRFIWRSISASSSESTAV